MAGWRDEIAEESERLRAEGRTPLWNGPRYAVESLDISRTAIEERPEVHLRLRPTDSYTFLAAQQLDRRLPDGTTPRSRCLNPDEPLKAPAFLQCSPGVNIAVVTADDMLVVTQRSDRVRMAPGVWNSSVNEGLSRHIDSSGRNAPDLHAVARRGMREELSLEAHEYTLDLLAFVLDVDRRGWSAHFYARLQELRSTHLQARRAGASPTAGSTRPSTSSPSGRPRWSGTCCVTTAVGADGTGAVPPSVGARLLPSHGRTGRGTDPPPPVKPPTAWTRCRGAGRPACAP